MTVVPKAKTESKHLPIGNVPPGGRRASGTLARLARVLTALTCVSVVAPAAALSYFPQRVVFDDQHRSAVLRIVNKDNVPRRYIIQWHRMRMTTERGLRPVPENETAPHLKPARDYVLFAPRQAMVPPHSAQAVRLMARVPADLEPGEYRSHLMITEPPRETDAGGGTRDGVQMQIKVVHRTTLPVILRHGGPIADVSVASTEVRRRDGRTRMRVTLGREGERSVYADASVIWEAPDGESHQVFGPATVAIYPELNQRQFEHPLTPPNGKSLEGGTLRYVLKNHPPHGGPAPILIDHRLRVP